MSIIPDLVLQQMIVQGIRAFREDEKLLRMLFRNFTQEEVGFIQTYFRENSFDISMNYPDQEIKLPAIVILMKSESEKEAFLRDFQQGPSDFGDSPPLPKAELRGDQTILGSGSQTVTGEETKELLAPVTAIGGSSNTIIAPEGSIKEVDPYDKPAYVVTMEGTAAGQRRLITSIEPSLNGTGVTITVDEIWAAVPDDTTVFTIVEQFVEPDEQVVGEWPKLFDQDSYVERFGSIYSVTYQLSIFAPDQELVIIIYNVLKAIIVQARRFLLRNGIMNSRMSGTDLVPQPEFYPSLGYSRALTVEFEYHFDVLVSLNEPIAETLNIQLFVKEPDVTDPDGTERIASDTEVDL